MRTVIDQPQFVVHVFAREADFVLLRHVAFRRDQPSVRTVFVQGAASARFPEEGSDVLHRVMHAVEMFLHLRPVLFPAPLLSGRAWPPVPRGPRGSCAQAPAFPRSSRITPPAGSPGRGSAHGSPLSFQTSLTSQSNFFNL